LSPELSQLLPHLVTDGKAITMFGYGDETTRRWATNNGKFDLGVVLVVGAIAIPNVLRSRTPAHGPDVSAVASTVLTVNTSQVTYSTTYEKRGYAPDLA